MADTDPKEFKRRLVKVQNDLWTQLGVQAKLEQRPMFAVLATAMRDYLKAQKRRPARS